MENPWFRRYLLGVFVLYLILGVYGVSWISDEFDSERMNLFAYVSIPSASLYFLILALKKDWPLKHKNSFWSATSFVMIGFFWGHMLLLNSISAPHKTQIKLAEASVGFAHERGGFGWIYRPRW